MGIGTATKSTVRINNVIIFLLFAVLLAGCPGNDEANQQEGLPNVIIMHVDDLGYGDVGTYGATKVQTPNIDRLAEEGAQIYGCSFRFCGMFPIQICPDNRGISEPSRFLASGIYAGYFAGKSGKDDGWTINEECRLFDCCNRKMALGFWG